MTLPHVLKFGRVNFSRITLAHHARCEVCLPCDAYLRWPLKRAMYLCYEYEQRAPMLLSKATSKLSLPFWPTGSWFAIVFHLFAEELGIKRFKLFYHAV